MSNTALNKASISQEVLAMLESLESTEAAAPILSELTDEIKKELKDKTKLVAMTLIRDRQGLLQQRREFRRKVEAAYARYDEALDTLAEQLDKVIKVDPEALDNAMGTAEIAKHKVRGIYIAGI
jgi:soluble cytochrome b562